MATDCRNKVETYLDSLPAETDLRSRLAENIRERELLRRLLKIAEQRRRVEESRK